jgi:hypothetical protein
MPFTISQFLDHGTQNPIVARLAVQTLEIIGQCNIADATRDGVVDIYINSLMKKLLRCWEIAERYRLDFNKQVESYKPPVAGTQMVSVPSVVGLEQECHNFLYEAKSFIRDALKAFNLLYGTGFVEASEYARPKKKVGKSLIEFAEATFGPNDPKTAFLKKLSPTVEQVVRFRNAVEHPGGHSGVLNIRNFRLEPDAKLSEPCWWTEKDGKRRRNLR